MVIQCKDVLNRENKHLSSKFKIAHIGYRDETFKIIDSLHKSSLNIFRDISIIKVTKLKNIFLLFNEITKLRQLFNSLYDIKGLLQRMILKRQLLSFLILLAEGPGVAREKKI